ncbi:MAG: hypothetical protein R3F43_00505 [bacterium]
MVPAVYGPHRDQGDHPWPDLIYAVTATLPEALVPSYVRWLLDGHIQAVIAGEPPRPGSRRSAPPRSRAATSSSPDILARYERDVAPALRADGIARFAEPHGVTFTRVTGAAGPDPLIEKSPDAGIFLGEARAVFGGP